MSLTADQMRDIIAKYESSPKYEARKTELEAKLAALEAAEA